MPATRKPPQKSELPQPTGTYSTVQQVQEQGGAALGELRSFLAQARGKSPQEFLGMVATSGLFTSTLLATIIVGLFIAGGTLIPYAIYGPPAKTAKVKPPALGTSAVADSPEAGDAEGDSPVADDPTSSGAAAAGAASNDDPLGIQGMEHADADKNPLEDSPDLDNLLDKLE